MDKLANSNQELTASYANEKRLLKEKIALGILKELSAFNGTLYVLPLADDGQEIPVALTMRDKDMVIHNGDFVVFKANLPSGPVEERITVGDLRIDDKREVLFHQKPKPTGHIFKLEEAKANISAITRLPKPKGVIAPVVK